MKILRSFSNKKYVKTSKSAIVIFFVLRFLIIFCSIFELMRGNYMNFFLCIIALILYTLPTLLQEKLKFEFPNTFECVIYFFIFSSVILGEVNRFYVIIPHWDTVLHLIAGFLCAGFGFSLFELCNKKKKVTDVTVIFTVIIAFCFSLSIGVIWEFIEYTADSVLKVDMQKGTIVNEISSIKLNPANDNSSFKVNNIETTKIITEDGKEYTINGGYLDIGLNDTMKDLFIDTIGAIIFCIFGIIYSLNIDKCSKGSKFASLFIPKINND